MYSNKNISVFGALSPGYTSFVKEVQNMAQATFSIRMDQELKEKFDKLCSDFGMTASTAFTI